MPAYKILLILTNKILHKQACPAPAKDLDERNLFGVFVRKGGTGYKKSGNRNQN